MSLRIERLKWQVLCACILVFFHPGFAAAGQSTFPKPGQPRTVTPIKHVIVIVGENRSFDHIFGLYRPRRGQTIWNLLSRGIVNADGTPGANFARAAQFQVPPQSSYYISAGAKLKYAKLPAPVVDGAPNAQRELWPPFRTVEMAAAAEPALRSSDLRMLTTGATGLNKGQRTDTRVDKYDNLPDGPFQLTGPRLPYDSYTGDTVHQFFQMWQQSDCSPPGDTNPIGCLSDLYPFVAVGFSSTGYGGGNAMALYNVSAGDVPLLKKLADEFTSSDNFHQSFMGGTGGNHLMLGTGDAMFFSDGKGKPAIPPPAVIANPDPQPGTQNRYIKSGRWVDCADDTAPGVRPIIDYLRRMDLRSNCEGGRYYMINNTPPAFLADGALRTGSPGASVPPSNLRTIGDALSEKGISWAYYSGAFKAAAARDRLGQAFQCAGQWRPARRFIRQTRRDGRWSSGQLQSRPVRGLRQEHPGPA
jgi:phospholipase C